MPEDPRALASPTMLLFHGAAFAAILLLRGPFPWWCIALSVGLGVLGGELRRRAAAKTWVPGAEFPDRRAAFREMARTPEGRLAGYLNAAILAGLVLSLVIVSPGVQAGKHVEGWQTRLWIPAFVFLGIELARGLTALVGQRLNRRNVPA